MPTAIYDQLCSHARETALLASAETVLGWDERALLPPGGAEYRAEQLTYLARLIHQRKTDPRLGEWLLQLADSPLAAQPHGVEGTVIRQLRREYDKRVKLPPTLVEELARATSLAQHAWLIARQKDDFASFRPHLEKMFHLKRQQAEAIGYDDSPYDALMDDFEPQAKTRDVAQTLAKLREALSPLVAAIAASKRRPDASILTRRYPIDTQAKFATDVAAKLGFDFARGRLDVTAHPFCSTLGPGDCRITTRYDERFFPTAFFGVLHEAGHGMYEQGLDASLFGLPPGEAISLGVHESQSRMWENLVGRSQPFWRHFFPAAQAAFPEALKDVALDDFFFAVNEAKPSLIRVEADEATYNLHIIIRFELEQALLSGDLKAADAPAAWNEKYQKYLGLTPPNDAQGVLQDIHWSAGLVGYFPTYSLGNLHAAQLFAKADADLGGLPAMFARGEFRPLLDWLRKNVHQHGQRYTASQLIERVTGKPLEHGPLIAHLKNKLGPLYGVG